MNDGIWYVVRTKPRQETVAEANLLRQGYAAYLPRLKVLRRIRRPAGVAPGADVSAVSVLQAGARRAVDRASTIDKLGVLGVVRFGIEPAELDAKKLDAILALESDESGQH